MKTTEGKFFQKISYLCIEGVIGVGKTTLSQSIADHFSARLVLEKAEDNPFLASFYQNRAAYGFQTQLWFLISRFAQLSQAFVQQDLFHPLTVSDYIFAKDKMFATINLDDNEMALYNSVSQLLVRNVPKPDAVVYLQASTEMLLKRIELRKRSYEFNMDPDYIDMLNQAYNHYFFHYTESPLLIINTNDIDFVNSPADLHEIIAQITAINPGTNYFAPASSRLFEKPDEKK